MDSKPLYNYLHAVALMSTTTSPQHNRQADFCSWLSQLRPIIRKQLNCSDTRS